MNMILLLMIGLTAFLLLLVIILMITINRLTKQKKTEPEQSNAALDTAVQERIRKLEEQTAIAIEANRAKSEFLATLSHEIRTPLNAVIGLSEIEMHSELPESSMHNIIQIHQSGSSLLGIINDILDISKIEAGGFELVPVEYDTATLISDTLNLNKVRIGSKPITLTLDINSDFPGRLLGDELRIRQVLNNILSNAIKYTDQGEIKLKIEGQTTHYVPKTEWSGGQVLIRFTVTDTGTGIRQEDMGKLFNSYTQFDTKTNRKIEGTGLGLVITKNLVEKMDGSIAVESIYGKGSVFSVEIIQGLPLMGTDCSLSPCIGEDTAEKLRNFNYAPARKDEDVIRFQIPESKVLVVDDLPVNLLVARGLLKPYGPQVDTAASGQEAIDLVRRHRRNGDKQYDLILMDHLMPEMDGIEAAKVIRTWENDRHKNSEQSELSQIPIVALTANALRGMKEYYLEQGFHDYISKPINPQVLNDAISRLIPEHKKIEKNEAGIDPGAPVNFARVMEAQSLDLLNHYLVSFSSQTAFTDQVKFDSAYFEKFSALVDSLDTIDMTEDMQEQAAALIKAGRHEDAAQIREILPAFCDMFRKRQETDEQDKRQINKILEENLLRLKKAILGGDIETTEAVMGELGTINLGPSWRELYFLLNDLLLTGDTEKALGAISLWERIGRR